MALPQFNDWRPNGVALNTFGLTNSETIDEVSIVMFGLIFPGAAIWNYCETITDTVWAACSGATTTWTDCATITNTSWTDL